MLDIIEIEVGRTDAEDPGDVDELALGVTRLGPFELRDDRIFSSRGRDLDVGDRARVRRRSSSMEKARSLRTMRSTFQAVFMSMTLNIDRRLNASRATSGST